MVGPEVSIHSAVDEYLLTIVTNAADNIGIQEFLFSILWRIYLRVELLGHMVFLCLAF